MNEVKAGQIWIHRKNHGGTKDNIRFLKILAVYRMISGIKLKADEPGDMRRKELYYVVLNDVAYQSSLVWGMKMFKTDLDGWDLAPSKRKAKKPSRSRNESKRSKS